MALLISFLSFSFFVCRRSFTEVHASLTIHQSNKMEHPNTEAQDGGEHAEEVQHSQPHHHHQKRQKHKHQKHKHTPAHHHQKTTEEEGEGMTLEEVEAAFATFAAGRGEGAGSHTRQFANLTREQRARLHELADAAGFVHFSFGNRKRRVIVLVRNPRPVYPASYDPLAAEWRPATLEDDPAQCGHALARADESDACEDGAVQLKVVSYNVLMDANPELSQYPIDDLLHTEERWPALLRILEQESADVIALQEGTPAFHKKLLAEEWVRRGYHISDCSGNSVKPMGNLLLSRYPFASVEERMYKQEHGMPKSVLLSVIAVGHLRISVAVVHLKAGTGFAPVRKSQIEQTIDMQEAHQADAYLFLGDFNMRDVEKENNERLDANYVDLWQAVHGPIEPGHSDGFTFDLARNPTARQISERVTAIKRTTGYSSRFDRIYFRSSAPVTAAYRPPEMNSAGWEVTDMKMIGTEPIFSTPDGQSVFPSDHFGLATTLRHNSTS